MAGIDATPTPLEDLRSVSGDIFARWDADMRPGKLLTALEGRLHNYDPRVTRIRAALDEPPAPTWSRHRMRIDLSGVCATAVDYLKGTDHPLRGPPTDDDMEGHAALLEQLIEHAQAVRAGTATLADFADFYCLTPPTGA